jgi:cytochrome P450
LRRSEPLSRVKMPSGEWAWLATRYIDIVQIMTDHNNFSRELTTTLEAPCYTGVRPQPDTLATTDPPDHTRLRRVVTPFFSSGAVARLGPRIQAMAEELLDRMLSSGSGGDLVKEYVAPLSTWAMCEIVGIPFEDRTSVQPWAEAALMNASCEEADNEELGWQGLRDYVDPFIRERTLRPKGDLLTSIAAALSAGDITRGEAYQLAVTIIITGHQTTISRTSAALLYLLLNPEIRRQFVAEQSSVLLVDEILRILPAGDGSFMHIAREDVQLASGMIRKGEAVLAPVTAANHDPAVFENAAKFAAGRSTAHVTFGVGVHRCLGAALARTQVAIALATFSRLMPDAALAVPVDSIMSSASVSILPLEKLPVRW